MVKPILKELCSDCEEWTDGECDTCEQPLCDDCADEHANNHDSDDNEF